MHSAFITPFVFSGGMLIAVGAGVVLTAAR